MSEIPRSRQETEIENFLQYLGEDVSSLNADARRELYKYAVDGRNIWAEIAACAMKHGPGRVLDVATGSATIIEKLLEAGYEGPGIVGLDIHENHFQTVGEHLLGLYPDAPLEFRIGDAKDLPFEDETFDTVTMGFYVYHDSNPRAAIDQAYRVLKPGGSLIVSSRGIENQERLWRLAGLAAKKAGCREPRSFYSQCNLQATEALLAERFPGQPIDSVIQDTKMQIPYEGWVDLRTAISTLRPVMVTEEGMVLRDASKLLRIIDTDVWSIFNADVFGIPGIGLPKKGFYTDRIRQGFFHVRKPLEAAT